VNIGINASFLNERPTGVGVYTREIATRLCALHAETFIFTSVLFHTVRKACIKRTPVALRGSVKLSSNLLRMVYENTLLPFAIKRQGIDVLFCPILEFPFVPSTRLVVTVHDLHPLYFPKQFGLAARHFRIALKLLPMYASRVIVSSHFVKREIIKMLPFDSERIDVLPLGCNPAVFHPRAIGTRQDFLKTYGLVEPFILAVGSLFPYKNIKTLLNAFLEIRGKIPHCLIIIGSKELSSEHLIEDERIRYLGYVEKEDIAKFYSYADLFVHPSFTEGFGMTVLEAMACGVPVISSHGGSLPEVVGDAGMLFDPYDSTSLGQLILTVLTNKRLRSELVEKGIEQVKKFSWDKTAEGVLESCKKAAR
jgi:glycosyltransferase involved in cell wall biosynthesis